MDVSSAFLYGERQPGSPRLFAYLPKGMEEMGYRTTGDDGERLMFEAVGNWYGARDGSAVWYQCYRSFLVDKLKFQQSPVDRCMFSLWRSDGNWAVVALLVDDTLNVFAGDTREWFLAELEKEFDQSPESDADSNTTEFAGYEITQNDTLDRAEIRTPKSYTRLVNVLDAMGLQHLYLDPATTPLPSGVSNGWNNRS